MAALNFALWDPMDVPAVDSYADFYDRHVETAQRIEQLGFHSYFIIEHQNVPTRRITAPTVFLTAVARATSTLRIGAMMWQLPFHHPIRLAQDVATLDHLSRGRVEFGTGIGVHEHEFIRWGVDYYQRAAMSEEALKIIKMAWSQDEVTFEGKYHTFNEALPHPRPYQQPHPPIWAAVHSDAAVEFAARNNYNVAQNIDTDEVVARKFDLFRTVWKECHHPGPMPRVFLQRSMYVAETDEKALEVARQYSGASPGAGTRFAGAIAQTRVGWGSHARGMGRDSERPDDAARAKTMEQSRIDFDFSVENGLVLVGSPDTVTRKLREGQQRIGYDLFVISPMGRMPAEVHDRSMELFSREVLPNFAH